MNFFEPCRPFYASTTKSKPRDVVVVLEMSASMRGDKFVKAKQATLTVMETLSIHDRVSIGQFRTMGEYCVCLLALFMS